MMASSVELFRKDEGETLWRPYNLTPRYLERLYKVPVQARRDLHREQCRQLILLLPHLWLVLRDSRRRVDRRLGRVQMAVMLRSELGSNLEQDLTIRDDGGEEGLEAASKVLVQLVKVALHG
jgi:hypothetical protein